MHRARPLFRMEEVRALILLVILGFQFLSLPLEIRSMILASAIGGQLISVSVQNPAHFAFIYGTWSPESTKLKLESCRLSPPKLCGELWQSGERPSWSGEDVRPLNAEQSFYLNDHYICKESPV